MKILIIILFIIHFIFIKWEINTKYIEFNKKNQKGLPNFLSDTLFRLKI